MDLYGILAHPAKHSVSPAMHNEAFKAAGIDAQYAAFDVPLEELQDFMDRVRHEPISGLSVSLPHKENVMTFLNDIDEDAQKIGAVNTVVNRGSNLYGYNTDYLGSNRALLDHFDDLEGKQVVVIGAGGAARAVIYGAMKLGANVMVMNRTRQKADGLAIEFAEMFDSEIHAVDYGDDLGGDILIHTTSIWTKTDFETNDLPYFVYPSFLENFGFVMDIAYPPLKTPLIQGAEDVGVKAIGADKMLLYQGVEQFKLWTNQEAPEEAMKAALAKVMI